MPESLRLFTSMEAWCAMAQSSFIMQQWHHKGELRHDDGMEDPAWRSTILGCKHRTWAGTLRQLSARRTPKPMPLRPGLSHQWPPLPMSESRAISTDVVQDAPVYQRGMRVCSRHSSSGRKHPADTIPLHGHHRLCVCSTV